MKYLVQTVKTFRPDFPKLCFCGKCLCRYFRLVHNYHCSAITAPCAYIDHELSPVLKWNSCSPPIKLPEFGFSGFFGGIIYWNDISVASHFEVCLGGVCFAGGEW